MRNTSNHKFKCHYNHRAGLKCRKKYTLGLQSKNAGNKKERQILKIPSFKGATIRNVVEFSTEIREVRRQQSMFKMIKENNCQTRISHPTKTSTKNERKGLGGR